jgi:hypothetical protein
LKFISFEIMEATMDLVYLKSWLYCSLEDSQAGAREFFNKLRASLDSGVKFPFEVPYEVALVHTRSGGDEWWMVGVLAKRNNPFDDSSETVNKLDAWVEQCGAGGYDTTEYPTARGGSIRGTFADSRYSIVDQFSTP